MDRANLEQAIARAEQHITLSEFHAARQREIIAELERGGHDSTGAKELLAVFLENLASHISDRDLLLKKLFSQRNT